MTQTVIVPGVGTLEFPDGMSQADMAAAIRKNFPEIHPPAPRMSPIELKAYFAARHQKAEDELMANHSAFTRGVMGVGKDVMDVFRGAGEIVGLESPADVARAREKDAALMRTTAGKVGSGIGYGLMAIPAALTAPEVGAVGLGARAFAGSVSGGAQGYIAPYASTGEHVKNTLAGAILGAAIPGAGAAAGKVVKGLASPEAKQLLQAGVRLTPGQMLGGAAKTVEDKLTSLPVVGSAIRRGQRLALDDFNLATVQKALDPIGVKLGKGAEAGYKAIETGRNAISKAYDSVLDQMRGKVDVQLVNEVNGVLKRNLPTLPQHVANKLTQILDEDVKPHLGRGSWVGGNQIKRVVSNLGNESRTALKSQDPAYRQLGEALQEIQSSVTNMLKRNNPAQLSKKLSNIDAAHARMLRVENAASRVTTDEGKFTPAQLKSAVKAEDSSYKHRAFTQGNALMQDWADAAKSSLPSKVPDSGTAGRLLTADTLAFLAPGLVAHAAYSRPARYLMEKALAPRPNPVTNYLAHLAQNRFLNAPTNALLARPVIGNFTAPMAPQQTQGGTPAW